jgi:predicted transcriptional regulator
MLPRVSEYMDTDVKKLLPEQEILEAVSFLLANRVTGAPVVDDNDAVIGIISEKDCLRLLAAGDNAELPQGKVKDFMSRQVTTVPSSMNIYFVAGMFLNDVVRRFPVVDNGKLVGVITRFDILRAIEQHLGDAPV